VSQTTPIPSVSLIGASNETPTGEQELVALRVSPEERRAPAQRVMQSHKLQRLAEL
jgi:hypothetical protein